MEQENSENVFYKFESFVMDEFNPEKRKQLLVDVYDHCDIKGIEYDDYFELINFSLSEFEESVTKGIIEKKHLLSVLVTLNLSLKQSMRYLAIFGYTLNYENEYEREILEYLRVNYRNSKHLKVSE